MDTFGQAINQAIDTMQAGDAIARILGASLVMAVTIWFVSARLEAIAGNGLVMRLLKALVPVGLGAGVYFLAARALGLEEARTLPSRLRR